MNVSHLQSHLHPSHFSPETVKCSPPFFKESSRKDTYKCCLLRTEPGSGSGTDLLLPELAWAGCFFVVQSPLVWGSGAPNTDVRNPRVRTAQGLVLPGTSLLTFGTLDRPGHRKAKATAKWLRGYPGHHLSCKMHAVSNQHIITELQSSHQREGQTCH